MAGRSRFSTTWRAFSRAARALWGMARRSTSARRRSFIPRLASCRLKGISWPGGPGDEYPRAQGDGRAAWREFVGSPAMCAAESFAFGRLSAQAGHRRRRSGLDAADRRIASEVAVLRLAANSVRTQPGGPRRQPQARAKADARDGDRGAGSAPRHQQGRARPQDLSLSAARREHHRAQSCLGQRHHLYSDGERLWRSIKYEEVHLKAYADGREARGGIGSWMNFYNRASEHPSAYVVEEKRLC